MQPTMVCDDHFRPAKVVFSHGGYYYRVSSTALVTGNRAEGTNLAGQSEPVF